MMLLLKFCSVFDLMKEDLGPMLPGAFLGLGASKIKHLDPLSLLGYGQKGSRKAKIRGFL